MSKILKPVEVFIKEKIKTRKMDVRYFKGKSYGVEDTTFNFSATPVKEPYGDVSFKTGYDNDPQYTSTFLMTAQEALELGKMLIDTAYDAMSNNRIIQEAESYEAKLSFLVLKNLITSIRISREPGKLENYEPPYYKYTITAYKDDEKVLSYTIVHNLSYFKSEAEIQYWMDVLTDKGRVKLYTVNWNPHQELEERKNEAEKKAMKQLAKLQLKPKPIQQETVNFDKFYTKDIKSSL